MLQHVAGREAVTVVSADGLSSILEHSISLDSLGGVLEKALPVDVVSKCWVTEGMSWTLS